MHDSIREKIHLLFILGLLLLGLQVSSLSSGLVRSYFKLFHWGRSVVVGRANGSGYTQVLHFVSHCRGFVLKSNHDMFRTHT